MMRTLEFSGIVKSQLNEEDLDRLDIIFRGV